MATAAAWVPGLFPELLNTTSSSPFLKVRQALLGTHTTRIRQKQTLSLFGRGGSRGNEVDWPKVKQPSSVWN